MDGDDDRKHAVDAVEGFFQFELLPTEVFCNVLEHLDWASLQAAGQVNSYWRFVVLDPIIWHSLNYLDFSQSGGSAALSTATAAASPPAASSPPPAAPADGSADAASPFPRGLDYDRPDFPVEQMLAVSKKTGRKVRSVVLDCWRDDMAGVFNPVRFPALESVYLDTDWPTQIEGDPFGAIARHCPQLKRVTLAGPSAGADYDGIDPGQVAKLMKECPHLTHLTCLGLIQRFYPPLPLEIRPHLKEVVIGGTELTAADLERLAESCPVLESLRIEQLRRGAGSLHEVTPEMLEKARRLKTLELEGSWLLEADVQRLPALRKLTFARCYHLHKIEVAQTDALRTLAFEECDAVKELAVSCIGLTALDASECSKRLEDIALQCPMLTDLVLRGCAKLTEEVLSALDRTTLPSLVRLEIDGCVMLSTAAVEQLAARLLGTTPMPLPAAANHIISAVRLREGGAGTAGLGAGAGAAGGGGAEDADSMNGAVNDGVAPRLLVDNSGNLLWQEPLVHSSSWGGSGGGGRAAAPGGGETAEGSVGGLPDASGASAMDQAEDDVDVEARLVELVAGGVKERRVRIISSAIQRLVLRPLPFTGELYLTLPALQELVLEKLNREIDIRKILQELPLLKKVELTDIGALPDDMSTVWQGLERLEQLQIRSCAVTAFHLWGHKTLTRLEVESCVRFKSMFVRDCPALCTLSVNWCSARVFDCSGCLKVATLSTAGCRFDEFKFESNACTALVGLAVGWNSLRPIFELNCPLIQTLKLGKSPHLDSAMLGAVLSRLPSLTSLTLVGCDKVGRVDVPPTVEELSLSLRHLKTLTFGKRAGYTRNSAINADSTGSTTSTGSKGLTTCLRYLLLEDVQLQPVERDDLLALHCNSLRALVIKGAKDLELKITLPRLQTLAVERCLAMTKLRVECPQLNAVSLQSCPALATLAVASIYTMNAIRLQQPQPLTSITHLIVEARRPPGGVLLRSAFPALESLDLRVTEARVVTAIYLQMVAEILPRLRKVKVLQTSFVQPRPRSARSSSGSGGMASDGSNAGASDGIFSSSFSPVKGSAPGKGSFLLRRAADDLSKRVRVHVLHNSGTTFGVMLQKEGGTIGDLKVALQERIGVHALLQKLIFGGRILENGTVLSTLPISEALPIKLVSPAPSSHMAKPLSPFVTVTID